MIPAVVVCFAIAVAGLGLAMWGGGSDAALLGVIVTVSFGVATAWLVTALLAHIVARRAGFDSSSSLRRATILLVSFAAMAGGVFIAAALRAR